MTGFRKISQHRPAGAFARRAVAWAVLAGLALTPAQSVAQTVNCQGLQAQIAAVDRARPPANTARFAQAAQRQQAEIARMSAHANAIGCNRQRFLFFGEPPPPQCGQINARLAQMQGNLAQLRARAGGNFEAGRAERRRMLVAQFDAYCRSRVAAAPQPGFFERLFGGNQQYREVPVGPTPEEPPEREEDDTPRRGSQAVCVRKCDGGFFPVSYSARRSNLDDLADLCSALCPNAETVLFTMRMGAEIDDAVSIEGESYTGLANAGRYKQKFNPSCTCKRADQSWVDVLAKAEKLLGRPNRRDIIVTPEKAEELSRPKLAVAKAAQTRRARLQEAQAAAEAERQRKAQEQSDRQEAAEVARQQAGIAYGRGSVAHFGLQAGRTETIEGPDGEKRQVRVIGPK